MSQTWLDGLGPSTPLIDDGYYVQRGANTSRMVRDKSKCEVVSIGRLIVAADTMLVRQLEEIIDTMPDDAKGNVICKVLLEALS